VRIHVIDATDARKNLEFFFAKLKEQNPKIIDGTLLNDGFLPLIFEEGTIRLFLSSLYS